MKYVVVLLLGSFDNNHSLGCSKRMSLVMRCPVRHATRLYMSSCVRFMVRCRCL